MLYLQPLFYWPYLNFYFIPVCFHCYCICILYVSGSLHFENHDLRTEPIVILFFCIPRMKINIKRSSKINTNVFLLFIAYQRRRIYRNYFLNFQWVKLLLLFVLPSSSIFCRTKSTILTISSWDSTTNSL
jgi:hypothetical protein